MNVLVIDIGGTHVKLLATGQDAPRQFLSGPELTSEQMVAGVVQAAAGWGYEAVSVGYPGPVLHGRPLSDNSNAFLGGFRLWENADQQPLAPVDVNQRGTNQLMLKGAR
jgi:predicted NBD/HSP70 family sugar kinase